MEGLVYALTPIAVLLFIVYKMDRFEPEPLALLKKLFILGMISVIPIILIETLLTLVNPFQKYTTDMNAFYTAFVVAAFSEELIKWLIGYNVTYNTYEYDEKLDGIIYFVFVSLGFAAVENVLYVVMNDVNVAVLRAITAVPAHMLFGVSMGYYVSMAKFTDSKTVYKKYIRLSIIVPILLHGIYDYILMSKYHILLLLFIPYLIFMWFFNIKKLRTLYKDSKLNHQDY